MGKLPQRYRQFQQEHGEIWQAYDALGATTAEAGPLEPKVRELIKLAINQHQRGAPRRKDRGP